MADNDRIQPHDEEKRNTIHWIDDGEGGMVYVRKHRTIRRQYPAAPFSTSAACKFLDLPPVNLRNLPWHLPKNTLAG